MAKKLFGQFLVEKGVITPAQLEEALSAQIVFGGRLGTNLIDMGVLTEKKLAELLAEFHRIKTLSLEDAEKVSFEDARRIPPELAKKTGVIPVKIEGKTCHAVTLDPVNIDSFQVVEFKTGSRIKPVVVPEITFAILLEKIYGIRRDVRFVTLSLRETKEAYRKKIEEREEKLVSREEREVAPTSFYGTPEDVSEDGLEVPDEIRRKWESASEEVVEEEEEIHLTEEVKDDEEAHLEIAEGAEDAAKETSLLDAMAGHLLSSSSSGGKERIEERGDSAGAELDGFEVTLLKIEEAKDLLSRATSREDIARGILSYAGNFFSRVVLFAVRKGYILGWDAIGPGHMKEKVKQAAFRLDENSLFGKVVRTGKSYSGPFESAETDKYFARIIGEPPAEVFIMPISFRGEIVNIIYGDSGPGAKIPENVSEFELFMKGLSTYYEIALRNREKLFSE